MITKLFLFLLSLFVCLPVMSATLDEDIEKLMVLLRIEEDVKNQYEECIKGTAEITEAEIRHEIQNEYSEIKLDAEDVALLVSIYSEFYNYACEYLSSQEIPDFYRNEIRERFTHAEIKSLIEFYKTPLGLKLNEQWLEINAVYGKILSDRQAADSFEAQRRYEERMKNFWTHIENKAADEAFEHGA